MPTESPNVGIAFALVAGAGSATALGASVVFFPTLVKFANRTTLAAALGLSAGVMTYVSFVEIFRKSVLSFEADGYTEEAYMFATLCFFGGVIFMVTLNVCVTKLLRGGHHHHDHPDPVESSRTNTRSVSQLSNPTATNGATTATATPANVVLDPAPCICCSDDPVKDLQTIKTMADELLEQQTTKSDEAMLSNQQEIQRFKDEEETGHQHDECCSHEKNSGSGFSRDDDDAKAQNDAPSVECSDDDNVVGDIKRKEEEEAKLLRMSINTAIAICLHNFPEGLATFVAALHDPKVGAVLAVAIAIHNIPEGLCVALPIFYATGKRWKAFSLAVCSGASEPLAALLGWAVLANSFSNTLYGVLFGLVGGMMVIISVRELLPTAHRYDPEDSVVTYSFILGMMIMALSLVLFLI